MPVEATTLLIVYDKQFFFQVLSSEAQYNILEMRRVYS